MTEATYTALFGFCGIGGGALGFQAARAALAGIEGRIVSVGGIDNDPAACRDFERLTGSPALCVDAWRLTPPVLRAFAGATAPDIVFASPPCKGFSALLGAKRAREPRYQLLNRLVVQWTQLMLQTWATPPRLVLLENVPRITSRGKGLLAEVRQLLEGAGYALHEGTHDCGELGGLAQRRRRYLMVARHRERVPPLLHRPPLRRVRGVGEVLEALPMPEDPSGGPMHRMPRISWLNWVRLALIPAGGDWRDLPGVLGDEQPRREVHRRHHVQRWTDPASTVAGSGSNGPSAVADPRGARFGHADRVTGWSDPAGTVTTSPAPSSGAGAVADPRLGVDAAHRGYLGVIGWAEEAGVVGGASRPSNGRFSVADPRPREWFNHVFKLVPWTEPGGAVTSAGKPSSGSCSVADPRVSAAYDRGYSVLAWDEASPTVAAGSHPGQGAYSVADIRLGCTPRIGAYGVLDWRAAAATIAGSASVDNGRFAIADPRGEIVCRVDDPRRPPKPGAPVIIAADGTWHRPLTTLELAALQGFPAMVDGAPLVLDGTSSSAWRERIGNAVPPAAAEAIAEQMLLTLLAADGAGFRLSATPTWVAPRLVEASP